MELPRANADTQITIWRVWLQLLDGFDSLVINRNGRRIADNQVSDWSLSLIDLSHRRRYKQQGRLILTNGVDMIFNIFQYDDIFANLQQGFIEKVSFTGVIGGYSVAMKKRHTNPKYPKPHQGAQECQRRLSQGY